MFRRRRVEAPTPLPQLSFEHALSQVLAKRHRAAQSGRVRFTAAPYGCVITVEGSPPLQLAPILMQRATECAPDGARVVLSVRTTIYDYDIVPGVIRRRTSPEPKDIRVQFSAPREARTWLAGDASRPYRTSRLTQWSIGVGNY